MRRGETAKIMSLVSDYADLLILYRKFAKDLLTKAAAADDDGAKAVAAAAARITVGCAAGLADLLRADKERQAQIARTPLSFAARMCLLAVALVYFYYSMHPAAFRARLGIALPPAAVRLDDYNHIVASMFLGYSLYAVFTGQRP